MGLTVTTSQSCTSPEDTKQSVAITLPKVSLNAQSVEERGHSGLLRMMQQRPSKDLAFFSGVCRGCRVGVVGGVGPRAGLGDEFSCPDSAPPETAAATSVFLQETSSIFKQGGSRSNAISQRRQRNPREVKQYSQGLLSGNQNPGGALREEGSCSWELGALPVAVTQVCGASASSPANEDATAVNPG